MEKRCETRFAVGQPVTVTILSGATSVHQAIVKNGSGNGMALEMAVPVAAGAALQIAMEDSLLLGEAVHCGPTGEGFLIGVLLDTQLSQLSRLAQMLEGFADGAEPAWRRREPQ